VIAAHDAGTPSSDSVDAGAATMTGEGGSTAPETGLCVRGGRCESVSYEVRDKLDLLFMIDNSDSMGEEQEALRMQFPRMMQVLTSGDLDGDGLPENVPAQSIHVGVITSDMGLPGIVGINNCVGLGQDGILQNRPSAAVSACQSSYPIFLSYNAGDSDPAGLAKDFECIATVGTGGCGFEQPLEATLKALWPSVDPSPSANGGKRVQFLADPTSGFGQLGHADIDNAGFLRNDAKEGVSMIAIVELTDEDDCSMADTRPFAPPQFLDPADPLASQAMNLRCHFNKNALYPTQRFVNGLRALRPGHEDMVIFAAIAGVPADLVSPSTGGELEDDMLRDAVYSRLFADPRMQEQIDTEDTPDPTDDRLKHSCEGPRTADPPIRLLQTAQGFGRNGVVQSICSDDFAPAIDAITARIGSRFGADCLPAALERGASGLVACDLLWELPLANSSPASTPASCDDPKFPFLRPRTNGPATSASGGEICELAQLRVITNADGDFAYSPTSFHGATIDDGWYYDDFSAGSFELCTQGVPARVNFSPDAIPGVGVRMLLDCAP
jgi:hypothetical protein